MNDVLANIDIDEAIFYGVPTGLPGMQARANEAACTERDRSRTYLDGERHVTREEGSAGICLDGIFYRPLTWLLRDLGTLGKNPAAHPDLLRCWLRDVVAIKQRAQKTTLGSANTNAGAGATQIQLFTGADHWRETWTIARAHLIGSHGYRYATYAFVTKPEPRWTLVGARHLQVLRLVTTWNLHRPDYNGHYKMVDDDGYTRDDRTL